MNIYQLIKKYEKNLSSLVLLVNTHPEIKEDLLKETTYLPENTPFNQRIWCLKTGVKELPKCKVCGKTRIFYSMRKGFGSYCSRECLNSDKEQYEKARKTNLERYGVDNYAKTEEAKKAVSEKNKANAETANLHRKETVSRKYGKDIENVFQVPEVIDKIKKSLIKHYGVDNPAKAAGVKEKTIETVMKKYAVEHVFQADEVKAKSRETLMARYGVDYPKKNKEINERISATRAFNYYTSLFSSERLENKVTPMFSLEEYKESLEKRTTDKYYKYKFKCNICNNVFEDYLSNGHIPVCRICTPYKTNSSKYEDEIYAWLLSIGMNENEIAMHNRTVLNHKELDFYIPSKKLAIEFDGLWSHSENAGNKDKNYHLDKTKKCAMQGIQLMHIFEDDWIYSKEMHEINSSL